MTTLKMGLEMSCKSHKATDQWSAMAGTALNVASVSLLSVILTRSIDTV
jgi:hypothetical protein